MHAMPEMHIKCSGLEKMERRTNDEDLKPIEKPKGLMMCLAYWMSRCRFGKVMTPMKVVVYAYPGLLG